MTSAFGKVILLGEHAVVFGYPALAAALERGVCARARPLARGPSTLRIPAWEIALEVDETHPVARATRALLAEFEGGPLALVVEADLPAAAGLGSSAALAVALTRAIAEARAQTLGLDQIERIAACAERCFHDTPSGIDVALAARGGLGVYRRSVGLEPIDTAPLSLAVALSGVPRKTRDLVARVRDLHDSRPDWARARLAALGAAAERGASALAEGGLEELGALMTHAHRRLADLGVSTPLLDALVDVAGRAGALGAKLTGAGGGGAVIALAPGREAEVLAAWRALGCAAFTSLAGIRAPNGPSGGGRA